MSLAIIGSGFGRTGTASLKRALEMLGLGPCHHMEEVLAHPEQVPYWQAAIAGEPVDWDKVFSGYRAQVDWPGAHVWRQLATVYPNAKVIHSIRPEDAWWNSFSATIGKLLTMYKGLPAPPHVLAMMTAMDTAIVNQTFGCAVTDRAGALAAFRRRTEEVRAAVPREQLLVFDVSQGWQPLCTFLDVPVPDRAFPHMNSTQEFWQLVEGKPLQPH